MCGRWVRTFAMLSAGMALVRVPVASAAEAAKDAKPPLRALVIVGGHGYDKPSFDAMLRSLEGIQCRVADLPKAADEFAPDRRDAFDVAVFYDMVQTIGEKHRKDMLDMLRQGKGVMFLHHALGARQDWDEYVKILGGRYYVKPPSDAAANKPQSARYSTYKHDEWINVQVKDTRHPITAGLSDFRIFDEVYNHYHVEKGVHVLLGADHPENEPTLAWTNGYGSSRIVYLQLGHAWDAFNDTTFRELVARSIRWVARRPDDQIASPGFKQDSAKPALPAPTDEGADWVRLFNGKDFDGWEIMGDKAGWEILKGGVIRSDGAKGGNWLRYAKQEFGDFVLRVQWRVSKDGNSGVFIRATREGQPWITGHEVQISNEPRDDSHCTGSLYGSVAVNPRPDESSGRWHEFEIRCGGEHIVVLCDGVKVIDATHAAHEALRSRPLKGFIGLQDAHAGPGNWIEWRNIRLKRLDKP